MPHYRRHSTRRSIFQFSLFTLMFVISLFSVGLFAFCYWQDRSATTQIMRSVTEPTVDFISRGSATGTVEYEYPAIDLALTTFCKNKRIRLRTTSALRQLLSDSNSSQLRRRAAYTLGNIRCGNDDDLQQSLSLLTRISRESDSDVAIEANTAIERLAGKPIADRVSSSTDTMKYTPN